MIKYTINVSDSRTGRHYCRIKLPSHFDEAFAVARAKAIAMMFGTDFECQLTGWTETGRVISIEEGSTV